MRTVGLRTMIGVYWRTEWRSIVSWVSILVLAMVATAAMIAGLYDTPEKIQAYAAAVTAGDALLAINGRVEGISSLGGVIQDEFGFMAAVALPFLGISLITRFTRRQEEAGRLEIVLSGCVARPAPVLAALTVTTAAILATALGFLLGLRAQGLAWAGAVLYAASLATLALVFAGLAALVAQLTLHSRSVYRWCFLALIFGYLLRGVGDVTGTWITWLSPLGWAERTAPFGARRWWVLLVPIVVGGIFAAVAVRLATRRDVGSAMIRSGDGPAEASPMLRTATGLAVWTHRSSTLGFVAGVSLFAGMMGALAEQLLDAMAGNQALAEAIGMGGSHPEDGFLAMTQLYLAVIGAGYAVQAVSALRTEEKAGRLETNLAGTLARHSWLTAQAAVILCGVVLINLAGSLALGASTAWSLADATQIGRIAASGAAYLVPELVLGGLAIAVFGLRPRLFPLAWTAYGATTFIALLGPGLQLPGWLRDLAPTTHVGFPPVGQVPATALGLLTVLVLALAGVAVAGFRRRGIPQH